MINLPVTFSDFSDAEIISPSSIYLTPDLLLVRVPQQMQERRIFVYLEVNQSATADFKYRARIICKANGRIVASYPLNLADFTAAPTASGTQSFVSLFNAGGTPVGDSLVLRLALPFDTSIPTVVLQPLRVTGFMDEVLLRTEAFEGSTLNGIRAYLAVLSSL